MENGSRKIHFFYLDEEDPQGNWTPKRFASYADAIAQIEQFATQKIEGSDFSPRINAGASNFTENYLLTY